MNFYFARPLVEMSLVKSYFRFFHFEMEKISIIKASAKLFLPWNVNMEEYNVVTSGFY